jgi:hypothetical protein
LFVDLPESVQTKARGAYALWAQDRDHPSLHFKKVHASMLVYSVRVDRTWRALGVLEQEIMIWFWIGSHADYEAVLRSL